MANNRFYPLIDTERQAYEACALALSGLDEASQHKVLKELALRLGREVVMPGAVRSAAAAAAARSVPAARGRGKAGPGRGGKGNRAGKAGPEGQAYEAWLNNQGAALRAARDAIVMDDPPTAEQRAMRAAASSAIRTGWQTFRAGGQ
jgi:hypothetical protein